MIWEPPPSIAGVRRSAADLTITGDQVAGASNVAGLYRFEGLRGLFFRVDPATRGRAKSMRFLFRRGSGLPDIKLGNYPAMSFAEARRWYERLRPEDFEETKPLTRRERERAALLAFEEMKKEEPEDD